VKKEGTKQIKIKEAYVQGKVMRIHTRKQGLCQNKNKLTN
jgi:hypothetical protein